MGVDTVNLQLLESRCFLDKFPCCGERLAQTPKTGIVGVAFRERADIYGPMRKLVRRWERGQ